jgi:hypothetical protein
VRLPVDAVVATTATIWVAGPLRANQEPFVVRVGLR